ncbi:MAG: hypothetical protein ACK4SF_04010 [Algoriphagus aquaeductus]|uniref:Uncharacterized protein n=1 Tax=Algoriphagus aquaeductus TaxID=475299 RepID=A0A326RMQ4_9BACT|nr:hypothetical protein [Algoriphagus aquaeductus]PZV80943.1 hypothetical protein CLV31_111110 [Algoriphagus aquaeductus]
MWKLVILYIFLNVFNTDSPIIIIIDDCKNWREVKLNPNSEKYAIIKDIPIFHTVSLSHNWLNDENQLLRKTLSLVEIKKFSSFYSSELGPNNWNKLLEYSKTRKIFILKPIDFCSQKRFLFNTKFELLEVNIHLGGDE